MKERLNQKTRKRKTERERQREWERGKDKRKRGKIKEKKDWQDIKKEGLNQMFLQRQKLQQREGD